MKSPRFAVPWTIWLLALTTAAQNSPNPTPSPSSSSINPASVLAVVATALPSSFLELELTNPTKAESVIASELRASDTPTWFASLPPKIQTYLLGQEVSSGNPTITGSATKTGTSGPPHSSTGASPGQSTNTKNHNTNPGTAASAHSGDHSPASQTPGSATETKTQSSGLSTGAKAGIGVGVGGLVVGAIGLGAAFYLVRRRRRQDLETPTTHSHMPELHANSAKYELDQPEVKHEMSAAPKAQELSSGSRRRHELE